MSQVIIIIHVLLGLGVIGLVLMQQGKGADAGAAFGSGASGTVFGAQGSASFLSRTTAVLAFLFFSTSLSLAVLSGHQEETQDLMDIPVIEQPQTDLPAFDGSDVPLKVPSISEQQSKQDLPALEDKPEISIALPDQKAAPVAAEEQPAQ